jgi:hypothetical protein
MGLLTSAFFKRDDTWYFVPNQIIGFQLTGGEHKEFANRISMQLSINLLLGFLTLGLGHLSWAQWLSPGTVYSHPWLPPVDLVYAIVFGAWLLCWINSFVLWHTVRRRLTKRETRLAQASGQSGFLRCTRPFQTWLIGLFVTGFLTQGFGTACFLHDGAPICSVIDSLLAIKF